MEAENRIVGKIGQEMPSSKREIEEDVLEELSYLSRRSEWVPVSELYKYLEMSKRDVNYYVKQMLKHGYVDDVDKNGNIKISELGRITGAQCRHRHETFTQFLQLIGVKGKAADEDACRMEHVVSEETVQQITNFVNYGDTFERVIKYTDLKYRYKPGNYSFLMGIYYTDIRCPRAFAKEFKIFSENITLHVDEDSSWFVLKPLKQLPKNTEVWYMERKGAWVKAEIIENCPQIPSDAFEYAMQSRDPITEGTILIAFVKTGEIPDEYRSRELDVHIW